MGCKDKTTLRVMTTVGRLKQAQEVLYRGPGPSTYGDTLHDRVVRSRLISRTLNPLRRSPDNTTVDIPLCDDCRLRPPSPAAAALSGREWQEEESNGS